MFDRTGYTATDAKIYATGAGIGPGIGACEVPSGAEPNRLMVLANRISEAAARVNYFSDALMNLSIGIHGPRPEPVSNAAGNNSPRPDSFTGRIDDMFDAVNRLERAFAALSR